MGMTSFMQIYAVLALLLALTVTRVVAFSNIADADLTHFMLRRVCFKTFCAAWLRAGALFTCIFFDFRPELFLLWLDCAAVQGVSLHVTVECLVTLMTLSTSFRATDPSMLSQYAAFVTHFF